MRKIDFSKSQYLNCGKKIILWNLWHNRKDAFINQERRTLFRFSTKFLQSRVCPFFTSPKFINTKYNIINILYSNIPPNQFYIFIHRDIITFKTLIIYCFEFLQAKFFSVFYFSHAIEIWQTCHQCRPDGKENGAHASGGSRDWFFFLGREAKTSHFFLIFNNIFIKISATYYPH